MTQNSRRRVLQTLASIPLMPGIGEAFAQGARPAVGAVLLHGKRDNPSGSLSSLASSLSNAGVTTLAPNMPWSSSRYLSGSWTDAMAEIDQAVATLRSQGLKRIVLVGHSLGCPAAMSYSAIRRGVTGLVLTAPGHSPIGFYRLTPEVHDSVERARAMVRAGRGQEVADFADNNQGNVFPVRTGAAQYLSYFDPNGQCEMRNTVGRVNCPVMWVVGTNDQVINWGSDIAQRLTKRPRSRYLVIPGANHRNTPSAASAEVTSWVLNA